MPGCSHRAAEIQKIRHCWPTGRTEAWLCPTCGTRWVFEGIKTPAELRVAKHDPVVDQEEERRIDPRTYEFCWMDRPTRDRVAQLIRWQPAKDTGLSHIYANLSYYAKGIKERSNVYRIKKH